MSRTLRFAAHFATYPKNRGCELVSARFEGELQSSKYGFGFGEILEWVEKA
jgi:hypothetical protein